MTRCLGFAGFVGVVLCMAAAALPAATAKVDTAALTEKTSPSICIVEVENSWGVLQSVSTGFLLGDGRFAVCDLGSLRNRGAARARLRFADGSTVTATEFGLADPGLGLAVLRVGDSASARPGLPLAAELPPLEGGEAVGSAGWRWGEKFTMTGARLLRGPKIETVASRSHIQPPEGIESFVRADGGRIEGASGGPIVDAEGRVLAVRLDVNAKNMPLVLGMPATTLRQSMLSSTPTLKPLAELPEPYWPVNVIRIAGEPADEKTFTRATQVLQQALVCGDCRGKGEMRDSAFLGMGGNNRPCFRCAGTGISLDEQNWASLAEWALQGTRVAWAPGVTPQARTQVRKLGVETMSVLGKVGVAMRRLLGGLRAVMPELNANIPHGVVLYARVESELDGPDGKYLILESVNTRTRAAVRVEDLLGHDGMGPLASRSQPARGTWFALAGTVVSRFNDGTNQGVYVLPFEWTSYVPGADDGRNDRDDRRDRGDDRRGRGDDGGFRGFPGGGGGGGGGGGRGGGGGGR